MTTTQYHALLTWLSNNSQFPSSALKLWEDMTIAENRFAVALVIQRFGKYNEAKLLFQTLLTDETLTKEQIAMAHTHLAFIFWHHEQQLEKAKTLIQQALHIIETMTEPLKETNRGQLWFNYLLILKEQNDIISAMTEIQQKTATTIVQNNSYIYYAYLFRAILLGDQQNFTQAMTIISHALATLTIEQETYDVIEQLLLQETDMAQRYEKLKAFALEIQRLNIHWNI